MKKTIQGVLTAIVTPFDASGEVSPVRLRRQIRRQLEHDNGIFCNGTNGEFFVLTTDEKILVTETCVDEVSGAVPVVGHIGEISTAATIKLGKRLASIGVDAVSVITPYFVPLRQHELIYHYTAIADAVPVPVFLYNIPGRTGNTIEPATARKLAKHPNIVGIKDSAGSEESLDGFLAVARSRKDFDVLVGPDHLILHGLRNGAAGCISGLGNIAPLTLNAIWKAHVAGDAAGADAAQAHYGELRKALYAHGFPPTMVKRALYLAMPEVGKSRSPAVVTDEVNDKVAAVSKAFAEAVA